MERKRKYKLFSIIALMFAIVALSIGYAAFSKVLTINASATVTPNEEDFNMKVYGFKDNAALDNFLSTAVIVDSDLSDLYTTPKILNISNGASATNALINNNDFTISNINVSTVDKDGPMATYYFVIKNEGKYPSYIIPLDGETIGQKVCMASADSNATTADIDYVCEHISVDIIGTYYEDEWKVITYDDYAIQPNEFIVMVMNFQYYYGDHSVSDSVDVSFNPIKIKFSTSFSAE